MPASARTTGPARAPKVQRAQAQLNRAGAHSRATLLGGVQHLHRTAGNRAVASLVGRRGGQASSIQRQSNLSFRCSHTPVKEMSPRLWMQCKGAGHLLLEDTDPVRFTFTGEILSLENFHGWIRRQGMSNSDAVNAIIGSHEFTGTQKARQRVARVLARTLSFDKRTVCIRPIQVAEDDGTNPTTLPSFAAARAIWAKCCIDVTVKPAVTVSSTELKVLDYDAVTRAQTTEELALLKAGGPNDCISVYVVETFDFNGLQSKDFSGGGFRVGGTNNVIVVEGVDPTVVAHEVGHAMGWRPHSPAGTVMQVTKEQHDQKEPDKVAWVICDFVRRGLKTAGGNANCTVDVI